MTPRTISSFLILTLILTSFQVYCQDDVQSQMLKRIEKLEMELKKKSDLITELTTVNQNLIFCRSDLLFLENVY